MVSAGGIATRPEAGVACSNRLAGGDYRVSVTHPGVDIIKHLRINRVTVEKIFVWLGHGMSR